MTKDEIVDILVTSFGGVSEIRSAYIYGSVLTDRYSSHSDIDVLFIVTDNSDHQQILAEIKQIRNNIIGLKLDLNIVFESELARRWHIYRPPTYFIGIKLRSELIWGDDVLEDVHENEITPELIYKRMIDLAQSSRAIYINEKAPVFWRVKYIKWLQVASLELLYLYGIFNLNYSTGIYELKKLAPEIYGLNKLLETELPMKEISAIAESMALFTKKKFIYDA